MNSGNAGVGASTRSGVLSISVGFTLSGILWRMGVRQRRGSDFGAGFSMQFALSQTTDWPLGDATNCARQRKG